MSDTLRLVTYNIRKGKGASGRRPYEVGELGDALSSESPDLLLCQEVFHHAKDAPSQTAELAASVGLLSYYLPNKHRRVGHHGNATFTRWPVEDLENFDLSLNRVERRGALYVRLRLNGTHLHVFNVHLSLSHKQRVVQALRLQRIIERLVPEEEPAVLAGDFNDWRRQLEPTIVERLGFRNAFAKSDENESLTWHARRPLFNLDRVYLRHLQPLDPKRLDGSPWHYLSDHLPLSVELTAA